MISIILAATISLCWNHTTSPANPVTAEGFNIYRDGVLDNDAALPTPNPSGLYCSTVDANLDTLERWTVTAYHDYASLRAESGPSTEFATGKPFAPTGLTAE